MSLANSKSASGEYIFAGFASNQEAYTEDNGVISYQGDDNAREVNLSASTTIKTRLSGTQIFGADDAGLFDALISLSASLRSNDRLSFETAFNALDKSMSTVSEARSSLGIRLNQVGEQQSLNEGFNLQLTKALSGLEDLDYARAISEMNLQVMALEAAQKAYTNTQGLSLFNYL